MRPLMPPVQTPDNLFHDGNPLTGELGTIVDAEHLNNVQGAVRDAQSELITVLNAAGINVDPSKQNQLLTALKALLLSRSNPFGDIKSDGTVKTALENLGLGEGSALPVGVPIPWPSATPPDGWVKCNGAAFDKAKFPKLA
ncbi:phage tail protein, partial [Enterobacter ludwigii]|uniref:phage tail protein n=1 Tax=Enterobacter ludwigii TaxID=299767 RepID=UPI0015E63D15